MKKPFSDLDLLPMFGDIKDLEKLAGLPSPKDIAKAGIVDKVVSNLARRSTDNNTEPLTPDLNWEIHKIFTSIYEEFGRPFGRFVGDLLDIILSGPIQTRLVNELIQERIDRLMPSKELKAAEPSKHKVPKDLKKKDIPIGGEPRKYLRHYLKRKVFLASLFLDGEEFPAFVKLMKQIDFICREECKQGFSPPETSDSQKEALAHIIERLRMDITQEDLIRAWIILAKSDFTLLEWFYKSTQDMNLVRPTFYEDLDKAYRSAKHQLKLLITDCETCFPPPAEKEEAFLAYLKDILEVYTHHHFVLKFFKQTRPSVSREEFVTIKRDLNNKIESLRDENLRLREDCQKTVIERDKAVSEARALGQETEKLRVRLEKLDPAEVEKKLQAQESKMNQITREQQATLEEDAHLRTALRTLDEENQRLTRKLQELKAIPDEAAYSVENLLTGKRVAIFGGVGRDHYLPILREAGVSDDDYEWFEGYHTISQAQTADIVGRSHIVAIITSYAGHLLLYQTRSCITPEQTLFLIHNSGAGSLRREILKRYKTDDSEKS